MAPLLFFPLSLQAGRRAFPRCGFSPNVSPVQEHIDPVTALTDSAAGGTPDYAVADAQVMARLIARVVQVRRIVPQYAPADAHARRNEIPQIPLPEDNTIAVELRNVTAKCCTIMPGRAITAN